jgi:hypothetical protein
MIGDIGLYARLMCPACGNRKVTVVFEPPSNAQVGMGDGVSPFLQLVSAPCLHYHSK